MARTIKFEVETENIPAVEKLIRDRANNLGLVLRQVSEQRGIYKYRLLIGNERDDGTPQNPGLHNQLNMLIFKRARV